MNSDNEHMIENQIMSQGIRNTALLDAMRSLDRSLFVPEEYRASSYIDGPLPIGYGQTISQPYIVAYMIDAVSPGKYDTVLEVGSGSGYLSCIISRLVRQVFALEIITPLYQRSAGLIEDLGINNIKLFNRNGYNGLPEHSPYDIIIASCASREIPASLLEQLNTGGRMIIPIEESFFYQDLILIQKDSENLITETNLLPVRFVPFVKK